VMYLLLLWPLLFAGAEPACPPDMVPVPGKDTCIDRYEWPNKEGVRPLVGASARASKYDLERGVTMNAWELCASVGKRMCRMDEWISACKGPRGSDYPFGRETPDRVRTPADQTPCNYAKFYRELDELKIFKRDPAEFQRLDQSEPSGSRPKCRSRSGAYDMMGNAEEWIICPDWMSRGGANCEIIDGEKVCFCLAGRYWSEPVRCHKLSSGHQATWWYYETSLRCCKG